MGAMMTTTTMTTMTREIPVISNRVWQNAILGRPHVESSAGKLKVMHLGKNKINADMLARRQEGRMMCCMNVIKNAKTPNCINVYLAVSAELNATAIPVK